MLLLLKAFPCMTRNAAGQTVLLDAVLHHMCLGSLYTEDT